MFKIVLRDSSLYAKQLTLFCLLWLISASAERIAQSAKRITSPSIEPLIDLLAYL